jgi:hypothetical protein
LAASCGFHDYVRWKLTQDKSLLAIRPGRVSLLESTIFWTVARMEHNVANWREQTATSRLNTVRMILEQSEGLVCYMANGDCLYDVVSQRREQMNHGLGLPGWDSVAWYDQVLSLLECHGYSRTAKQVAGSLLLSERSESGNDKSQRSRMAGVRQRLGSLGSKLK